MIYLFNNNEEMIRIIPNSAIKRLYQTQTLTDENYISDRLDVEIQALNDEELSELEYMAIDDIENPQRFHYYFIVKETTAHQITSLTGVQSGIEELRKTPVYDMRPTNLSPKLIADRLLEGTNWQAGYTTDDVGTISTNFYYTDVFSALKKMCMAFGIEMQFFVEITTNRIGARYIEFRKRTGKSVGKRVVYGHNALKIVKEVEKTNTVTALIGRGKGVQVSESDAGNIGYGRKIGFENVEWKKSSGAPVDKPLGQEFVEIPELTLQYGIKNSNGTVRPKIGFVEFQDEESETRLIDRTYNALLELSRPQVLLETSSVYLPDTGIGDTINVVRHDRDLRYQTRVFEITWDRLANQAVDMKLGDRLGESENKRISNISNQISGNISTELGPTIEELVDRVTTADGKNTNWYTDYDPMENPETMGLVRVNDNWYQPDPEYEGEFILKQWNGEMWVEILRTSGNPELVRRFEEVEQQAEQAKEAAKQAYEDAVADAKVHADSEVQASKEHFDGLIAAVESEVANAKATANSAVEQIDTAVTNAGFTSLDDTIQNMNHITANAEQSAQQATANASNAYSLAQTSISEAQTAQTNSLIALGKSEDALVGVSNLDIRVDDVEGELELKADNTFINVDGTLTTLSNAITFNANKFSRDMQRIESRVESMSGEVNLVVLRDAFENSRIATWTTYPNTTASSTHDTMRDLIDVEPSENLVATKETVAVGSNSWHINFYNSNGVYVSGVHATNNRLDIVVPDSVVSMWVAYPKNSKPQIIRGTEVKPYRPNLADQMTTDEMVIFRNEYDEYADRTERRLSAIDSTGGSLELLDNKIVTTADSVRTDMTALIGNKVDSSDFSQFYQNEYLETVGEVSRKISLSDVKLGTRNLIKDSNDMSKVAFDSYQMTNRTVTATTPDKNQSTVLEFGRTTTAGWLRISPINFELGEEYTFSVWIKRSSGTSLLPINIGVGVEGFDGRESVKRFNVGGEWQRVNITAPITRDVNIYNFVELRPVGNFVWGDSARFCIWRPQIEKGNVPSDWYPAPEDSETRINHIQTEWTQTFDTFEQTITGEGGINTQLQTLENSLSAISDPATGRLTVAEQRLDGFQNAVYNQDGSSKITQLATAVNSVVSDFTEAEKGSENLLPKTNFEDGILPSLDSYNVDLAIVDVENPHGQTSKVLRMNTLSDSHYLRFQDVALDMDEIYTFSMWVKRVSGGYYSGSYIGIGTDWETGSFGVTGDSWTKVEVTGKPGKTFNFIQIRTDNQYVDLYIYRPKLEVGKRATRWSPGLKDIASQSQISQLADNINLRVSKGDVLSQINIEADRTLIQSNKLVLDADSVVFTGSAFIPSAQIQSLHADKINAGTINSARLNATEIVTQGLTAGVVTSTHIKSDTALFDKLFSTNLATDRLAARDAWITNANIKDLSASKITTGTLNAADVNIVNLDVNNLAGNKSTFLQSAWPALNSMAVVDGTRIRIESGTQGAFVELNNIPEFRSQYHDGTGVVMAKGRVQFFEPNGGSQGYIGRDIHTGTNDFGIFMSRGKGFRIARATDSSSSTGDKYYTVKSGATWRVAIIEDMVRMGLLPDGDNQQFVANSNKIAKLNGWPILPQDWPTLRPGDQVMYEKGKVVNDGGTGVSYEDILNFGKNGALTEWWLYMRQHVRFEAGYSSASDRRIKYDIQPTNIGAIETINELEFKEFKMRRDDRHVPLGLIAQESGLLRIEDPVNEALNMELATMLSLKGVQELYQRIKELEEEVKTLKENDA